MKTKSIQDQVWPIENYTDKIHSGMKIMFVTYPHLTFTVSQMKQHLKKGFSWLVETNEQQSVLLSKLISTGIKKLIQGNIVKKVTSNVSVESQWQAAKGVSESGMTNVTSEDAIAKTVEAQKASRRRAVNSYALWKMNRGQSPSSGSVVYK